MYFFDLRCSYRSSWEVVRKGSLYTGIGTSCRTALNLVWMSIKASCWIMEGRCGGYLGNSPRVELRYRINSPTNNIIATHDRGRRRVTLMKWSNVMTYIFIDRGLHDIRERRSTHLRNLYKPGIIRESPSTNMSTSSNPTMAAMSPMTQMTAHVSLKMAQAASMIVPPVYLLSRLVRRGASPFTIRRLMNVSTGSVIIGAGLGVGMSYGRLRNEPEIALIDRIERMVGVDIRPSTDN